MASASHLSPLPMGEEAAAAFPPGFGEGLYEGFGPSSKKETEQLI